MSKENIIEVQGLTKRFKSLVAVDNISFSVKKGSLFAFLGTNGAGKSTTINMLTTILQPSSGSITVAGYQVGKNDAGIRSKLGVVFQQSLLDPLLSVRENIEVRASFYAIDDPASRIDELSGLIGLEQFLDRRYGKLSGGQRRRADIARALVNTPDILFLDEPTTGLDPKSREDVWATIADLQKNTDLTVFLTTHYMEEAERADDVYVIQNGLIIANDTPQSLRAKYARDVLTLVSAEAGDLMRRLDDSRAVLVGGVVEVEVSSAQEALQILKKYENMIDDFEFRHGNLDDVFLRLTERGDKEKL